MRDVQQYHLKHNARSTIPRDVIILDTESREEPRDDGVLQTMRLGWTAYGRRKGDMASWRWEWQEWKDAAELWQYVTRKCRNRAQLYLIAHNAYYDLQAGGFFRHAGTLGWRLGFVYDKGLVFIMRATNAKKTLTCLSSTNYFPYALRRMGDLIGLPKQDIDFRTADEDTLSAYCRNDVDIVRQAMLRHFSFLHQHDLGRFRMTAGSQAMAAFRHRFMPHKVTLHNDTMIKAFEREAYVGGRVECFRIGEQTGGPWTSLDVHSMYPSVMRDNRFPSRWLCWDDTMTLRVLARILTYRCVIAEVYLDTDEPAYPLRHNSHLCFPIGQFTTTLTTPELRYAIEHGHIRGIGRVSTYERAPLFTDFVNYFWTLRAQAMIDNDPVLKDRSKLMMNSFYGKWGQKRTLTASSAIEDVTAVGREETLIPGTLDREIVYRMLGVEVVVCGEEEHPRSAPAIAAHITAYARMHLWNLIQTIGRERVLYCDTDSVTLRVTDRARAGSMLHPTALGKVWDEATFERLVLHGPKDVEKGDQRYLKGVKKDATEIAPGTFEMGRFERMTYHLTNRINEGVYVHQHKKTLSRVYHKGHPQPSGHVLPFHLEQPRPAHVAPCDVPPPAR